MGSGWSLLVAVELVWDCRLVMTLSHLMSIKNEAKARLSFKRSIAVSLRNIDPTYLSHRFFVIIFSTIQQIIALLLVGTRHHQWRCYC